MLSCSSLSLKFLPILAVSCCQGSVLLQVIASRPNVCKQLHMPAQSGSSAVLQRMRRGYDRDSYDALVAHVRDRLPQVRLCVLCGATCPHMALSLFSDADEFGGPVHGPGHLLEAGAWPHCLNKICHDLGNPLTHLLDEPDSSPLRVQV